MSEWLQKQWAHYSLWHVLLLPLSALFWLLSFIRRSLYQSGVFKVKRLPVPVIVIGNINIGGTGKTPLVIWLAEQLKSAGFKPGIISRGYGGHVHRTREVLPEDDPTERGDEPVLIAKRTRCPVFVNADRVEAGLALLAAHPQCDVIISDDGLQHYRLHRDVEIAVVDGAKGFGNQSLLPAGPLREGLNRLQQVDALVINGGQSFNSGKLPAARFEMQLKSSDFFNLLEPNQYCKASAFSGKQIVAIAGIGNPQRFFQQLQYLGLSFQQHAFQDHYAFTASDFKDINADILLMTEKDAVKCISFAKPSFWVLPVSAVVENGLMTVILNKLRLS